MKNYDFDIRSLSHLIRFGNKSWVKVPKNKVDKPFNMWRDPMSGREKLLYMEEYDNFEEADEAASAAFFSAAAMLSGFAAADNAAIEAPDKSRTDTAAARVFFIIIVHLTISNAE